MKNILNWQKINLRSIKYLSKPFLQMKKQLSIAILPFVNMSSDQENEYFSDGVTEEIINALSKINGLKVVSRTSSFLFKGKNLQVQQIAKQLSVSMILEGSVRKASNNVRVTAQLINAEDGFQFWSQVYNHKLDDIFYIQDQISMLVAEKLREHIGHLDFEEKSVVQNPDIDIYDLYLKSKYNFNKLQKESVKLAVQQIEQVIASDPGQASYYATKSVYYTYLGTLNVLPTKEAFLVAKEASLKALSMDSTNPEANYAIALAPYFVEGDIDKAFTYFSLALKYRPSYPDAFMAVAMCGVISQDKELALKSIHEAISIDPLSPIWKYYYAAILLRLNQPEKALTVIDEVLGLMPHHTNSYTLKGVMLTRLGRYDEAIEHYKHVPVSGGKTVTYYSGTGVTYATSGNKEKAAEYLEKARLDKGKVNIAYEETPGVFINIYLENFDEAFKFLEKDIENRKHYLRFYETIPVFERLKNDERYKMFDRAIVSKITAKDKSENTAKTKYINSGLSEEKINNLNQRLLSLMENQKPFIDSGISLKSLAERLSESANHVSQVINDKHKINFFDFINIYRIKEMQMLIKNPHNKHLTLLALAYEAGFQSKTTFNTAFKKLKGQTPGKYFKGLTN